MRKLVYFMIPAVFAYGCATLAQQSLQVDLAAVEGLQIGKTTREALRVKFGGPTQILPFLKNQDIWFYTDSGAKDGIQRASFVFDKEKDVLLTATWLPGDQDSLSSKAAALSHFKSASFQIREVGWIAHHEYSNETVYSDPGLGVSIRINRASQSVIAIAFGGNEPPPLAKQE